MIIFRISAGLGNQMFQYACGRAVSLLCGEEMKIDVSYFNNDHSDEHRFLNLTEFNIKAEIANENEIVSVFPGGRFGKKAAAKLYARSPMLAQSIFNYYQEQTPVNLEESLPASSTPMFGERGPYVYNFHTQLSNLTGDAYLDGYWQTEKYFNKEPIRNKIQKELSLRDELQGENKQLADSIRANNSVSIHFRRGDYSDADSTLPVTYYKNAMKDICNRVDDVKFYIFSDDIPWVKETVDFNSPVEFVTNNDVTEGHKDIQLMSLCNHNIIANSTFSWWGAWLNENSNKIVLCPSVWFNGVDISTIDIIPSRWEVIDFE